MNRELISPPQAEFNIRTSLDNVYAILNGLKPVGNFERAKHPRAYHFLDMNAPALRERGLYVHHWDSPEGPEYVVARTPEPVIAYFDALLANLPWLDRTIQFGRLLGYTDAAIAAWIPEAIELDCRCSKCVGLDAALIYKHGPRHAHLAAMAYASYPRALRCAVWLKGHIDSI